MMDRLERGKEAVYEAFMLGCRYMDDLHKKRNMKLPSLGEPMTDEQRNMTQAEKTRINAEVAAILKDARAHGIIK